MAKTTLARALVALSGAGSIGLVCAVTASLHTTACAQKQCEDSQQDFGKHPTDGQLIDENTWESTEDVASWLDYPGKRKYDFYPRGLEHRKIAQVFVYISANPRPNSDQFGQPFDDTRQYTLASGDVAQITTFPDPGDTTTSVIEVKNNTCAQFFVRVVVQAYPKAPAFDAGVDASPEAESDAGADAANDARTLDAPNDGPNDGASE